MHTITANKSDAIQAYKEANPVVKTLLTKLFGKEVLEQKITDLVKTFEDARDVLGLYNTDIFSETDTKDEIAYKKIKIIIQVLNEGWVPDWNNGSQYKYFPYFNMQNGFSYSRCSVWLTRTTVGSRLCFKSSELAMYAGKQFEAIYKDFFTMY